MSFEICYDELYFNSAIFFQFAEKLECNAIADNYILVDN